MKLFVPSACLLIASVTWGQNPAAAGPPNATKMTKFILGVADLDRTYAFYHGLGLQLDNNATALGKPNALADMLLKLVDVPAGTKFRNMMLKIPGAVFPIEVTEFTGMDVHPMKPRIQDPGAAVLHLQVGDVNAALAIAKKAGGEVVTTGGAPVTTTGTAPMVMVRDPDGYYVVLLQTDAANGNGKVTGGDFGSIVVDDVEKVAAFYVKQFGILADRSGWTTKPIKMMGTPGAQVRMGSIQVLGTKLPFTFFEFKGLDRKAQTPRIPDPGAAGIGLQVRDIDAAIKGMVAAGGTSITEGGSVKLGNGKVGFVRDPFGILVELAQ